MDIWSKEKRSAVMAKIRGKDTKPELIVRRYLYHRGYRYRKNFRGLPGTPDVVLRKYRVVIFVHGCFWHGHEGCKYFVWPKSNADFWKEKISGNIRRDKDNIRKLSQLGWNIITVWECELKTDKREETLSKLVHQIKTGMLRGE